VPGLVGQAEERAPDAGHHQQDHQRRDHPAGEFGQYRRAQRPQLILLRGVQQRGVRDGKHPGGGSAKAVYLEGAIEATGQVDHAQAGGEEELEHQQPHRQHAGEPPQVDPHVERLGLGEHAGGCGEGQKEYGHHR